METTALTKDSQLCMSLAGRPSNVGTRFHNHLYNQLGLDYVYKAFTTTDVAGAVAGIRALGIRGCGVSMPYKEEVIPMLDSVDDSARVIASVNTVVNTDGQLAGYNTDYLAIVSLLRSVAVPIDLPFAVLGSGGMARAVVAGLRDMGFQHGVVVARNAESGAALAADFGFRWTDTCGADPIGLIVNATPVGMAGGPASGDLAAPAEAIDAAELVFDVVAMPAETPMIQRARQAGTPVVTGAQVQTLQAVEQFVLYTGIRPSADQVAAAAAFSRQPAPA